MKMRKLLIGTFSALMGVVPFVAADVRLEPMGYAIKGGLLLILVLFIVGAFFLIRYIIRKNKQKAVIKKVDKNASPDIRMDKINFAK
jgi:multidrug efflux pump subunit AcrB